MGEIRTAYKILVGKLEGMRLFGGLHCTGYVWIILKLVLKM
jgi:hypothetical protein